MKKHIIIVLLMIATSAMADAQEYYVTHVDGRVFLGDKPLRLQDKLTTLTHLAGDRTARVSLFSPAKGRLHLTFEGGRLVAVNSPEKHTELYDIIVKDNILKEYNNKILTTRGIDFDIFNFFNPSEDLRILLIDGQYLPERSKSLQLKEKDDLQLCLIDNGSENCISLKKKGGNFLVNAIQTGLMHRSGRIKLLYDGNAEYFPKILDITIMNQSQLGQIAEVFKSGLTNIYHGNKESLIADIEASLQEDYGNFFEPALTRKISQLLKD